jgi:ribosome-binding protein aMBF1 (putative translation factor)
MRTTKRQQLEAAGWTVGTTQQFLGLSDEETVLVAIRSELARTLKVARLERSWTQARLADALGSSQSRVAKMEAADHSVSIDLLIRALIVVGANSTQVGAAFAVGDQKNSAGRRRTQRN